MYKQFFVAADCLEWLGTIDRRRLSMSLFLSTCVWPETKEDEEHQWVVCVCWRTLDLQSKPSTCILLFNSSSPSTWLMPGLSDPGPEELSISTKPDTIATVKSLVLKDRGVEAESALCQVVEVLQPIGFRKFLFCFPPKRVFRDFAFGFSRSSINLNLFYLTNFMR